MFRKYGFVGIVLIVISEIAILQNINPIASWYFPIIWTGYILLIDAIVYSIKHESFISSRPEQFAGLVALSAAFWWAFEFINVFTQNWAYVSGSNTLNLFNYSVKATIAFATVLPAIFETLELILTLHLFDHAKLKKSHNITKRFLHTMMGLGILFLILPIIFPTYFFPLVWFSFFFLLDPINYLHRQPSIIAHLKDRKLKVPLSLFLAGTLCGFLWEFWNYWAPVKWVYDLPYIGFLKVFEMPILGYIGYGPFAWELFAMYNFILSMRYAKHNPFLHTIFSKRELR